MALFVPTSELIWYDVLIADLRHFHLTSLFIFLFCSLLNQPGNGSDSSSCLPLPPAMPVEGLQAVCREVRLCPLWGSGNLEPHFLPCWDKNLSSLKAREGEGEDLTAGVLQPPVPSDRNVVLCASLPQSLINLIATKCWLFLSLSPFFWFASSLE